MKVQIEHRQVCEGGAERISECAEAEAVRAESFLTALAEGLGGVSTHSAHFVFSIRAFFLLRKKEEIIDTLKANIRVSSLRVYFNLGEKVILCEEQMERIYQASADLPLVCGSKSVWIEGEKADQGEKANQGEKAEKVKYTILAASHDLYHVNYNFRCPDTTCLANPASKEPVQYTLNWMGASYAVPNSQFIPNSPEAEVEILGIMRFPDFVGRAELLSKPRIMIQSSTTALPRRNTTVIAYFPEGCDDENSMFEFEEVLLESHDGRENIAFVSEKRMLAGDFEDSKQKPRRVINATRMSGPAGSRICMLPPRFTTFRVTREITGEKV